MAMPCIVIQMWSIFELQTLVCTKKWHCRIRLVYNKLSLENIVGIYTPPIFIRIMLYTISLIINILFVFLQII